MKALDWNTIKEEDLKDGDYLVKRFRRFLKKECEYSAEAARFTADIIENPYGKHSGVDKTYVTTTEILGKTYEIYFCTVEDSSPTLFEFYMLVDAATLQKKDEEWFSYYLSKKKFVF